MTDAVIANTDNVPAGMTFVRRCAIAVLVFLAGRAINNTLALTPVIIVAYKLAPGYEFTANVAIQYFAVSFAFVCILFVLIGVQRSIAIGTRNWLVAVPPRRMVALIIALLVLSQFIPRLVTSLRTGTVAEQAYADTMRSAVLYLYVGEAIASASIWIWWCSCTPPAKRHFFFAALTWLGFKLILAVFSLIVPMVLISELTMTIRIQSWLSMVVSSRRGL